MKGNHMNSIGCRFFPTRASGRQSTYSLPAVFGSLFLIFSFAPLRLGAQNKGDSNSEFKRLTQELSSNRLDGSTESESQQEKALAFLDSAAISILNGSASPDLQAADQRLASFTSRIPPVGESYRLLKLGGAPPAYALVANFGLGGPAAVRIYSRVGDGYALTARIDQFSQKGFLDSDIELIPVASPDAVFVTVAGRTDDLSTGLFSAWRFDGHAVVPLWTSELLLQSNYQVNEKGFQMTYCGQPDEDSPEQCLQMTRDLYRFQDGQWKRIETVDVPPVKPAGK
jgi:hypothetical protein